MEQLKKLLSSISDYVRSMAIKAAQSVVKVVNLENIKKLGIYIVNLITSLIVSAAQPMIKIAKKHPIAFSFAMIFHIALVVGLMNSNVEYWKMPEPPKGAQQEAPTKAVTIDVEVIKAEREKLADLEKQKQKKLASDIQKSEAAKKAQKHAEEHRKAEEKKAKEAAKQKALAEEKTREELAKAEEAAKKKELAEAKAKEAEKKEAIAKQLTEEAKKKNEALDAERIALQEKFEDEQNVRALITEIQAEEDADRKQVLEDIFNELKENYIGLIASKVRKEWRYLGAEDHWVCYVHIIQSEVGDVLAVNIQNCTIDDSSKAKSFKDSIERAVYKASPLPHAPDKDLFDAEVLFQFRVN